KHRINFQQESGLHAVAHLQEIPEIKDDRGLQASSLTMPPNASITAPDPSESAGQYLVVVKGSFFYGGKGRTAYTPVFVDPGEPPFQFQSGAEGLEAIVLNFPKGKAHHSEKVTASLSAGSRKWRCELCEFTYDEALGLPEDGIPAGTRWEDVPP